MLQSKFSQLSMGLAPAASVCAQVCVCVLGCSRFRQLRIKIEGMREQYGSSIINSVDARRRAEWIVCAFAVYNSASPRARSRGMGLSQGARQTLSSLLLLHCGITGTREQNKSEPAVLLARFYPSSMRRFILTAPLDQCHSTPQQL